MLCKEARAYVCACLLCLCTCSCMYVRTFTLHAWKETRIVCVWMCVLVCCYICIHSCQDFFAAYFEKEIRLVCISICVMNISMCVFVNTRIHACTWTHAMQKQTYTHMHFYEDTRDTDDTCTHTYIHSARASLSTAPTATSFHGNMEWCTFIEERYHTGLNLSRISSVCP